VTSPRSTPDYPEQGNASTGEVAWLQLDVGDAAADMDHRISAEERVKAAMARQ
jgi:hypothetical protein